VTYSASSYSGGAGGDTTWGYSFTTTAAVTVVSLDYGSVPTSGGVVRLYDGTGNVLATVTALTTDPTETTGGLVYSVHSLQTPVHLASNTTYFIAGDIPGNTNPDYPTDLTTITTVTGITYGGTVSETGFGHTPTTDARFAGFLGNTVPVNFDLSSSAVVPEPSTAVVAGK
jgi:hypothetical protein